MSKAFEWFQKGAKAGDPNAQYDLGVCWECGEGVKRDQRMAAVWFRRAAKSGERHAQYNLGLCMLRGEGTRRNYQGAVAWLRRARKQGDRKAARVLSRLRTKEGRALEMDLK